MSEIVKFYLNAARFGVSGVGCNQKFDALHLEYEYWNAVQLFDPCQVASICSTAGPGGSNCCINIPGCTLQYPDEHSAAWAFFVDLRNHVYNIKELYNTQNQNGHQLFVQAYLQNNSDVAVIDNACNSSILSYTSQDYENDGNLSTSYPLASPNYIDRVLFTNFFEIPFTDAQPTFNHLTGSYDNYAWLSTNSFTDYHMLLSAERVYTGGAFNYYGNWFAQNIKNNIFSSEKLLIDEVRQFENSNAYSNNVRRNDVQAGGFLWFNYTHLKENDADPVMFTTNSPVCATASIGTFTFNYTGPLEHGIYYTLTISNATGTVSTQSGTSGVYKPAIGTSAEVPGIRFNPVTLAIGNYTAVLTLTYKYGCVYISPPQAITVTSSPIISVIGNANLCDGDRVNLQSVALQPGCTLTWNRSIDNFNYMPVGTYIRTISNSAQAELVVTEYGDYNYTLSVAACGSALTSPDVSLTNQNDARAIIEKECNGSGSIRLNVVPAMPGATYQWSNGATGNSITLTNTPIVSNLTGSYRVRITNDNGCEQIISKGVSSTDFTYSFTATAPPAFTVPSSCGASDGRIELTLTGGVNTWQLNGVTGNTLAAIPAGQYISTLTETGTSCNDVTIYNLSDGGITLPTITQGSTNNCYGDNNVSLTLSSTLPNYTYTWNNGLAGNLVNLSGGHHLLTIADPSNSTCRAYMDFFIAEGEELFATAYIIHESCSSANGSIVLSQITPVGTSFQLSLAGVPVPGFTSLAAGNYTLESTFNGCTQTENIIVGNLTINATAIVLETSCMGGNDGEIQLEISGGSPYAVTGTQLLSYDIEMNNVAQASENITGLSDNQTYNFDITDSRGCTVPLVVALSSQNACACSTANAYVVDRTNNTISSNVDIANISTTTMGSNIIYCTSDLILDNPFNTTGIALIFDNFEFIMNPGTKIIVTDGTSVLFNGTAVPHTMNIHGCSGMWDGIYVNGTSSGLLTNLCTISGTANGVVFTNGGRPRIANTNFTNNLRSLQMNKVDFNAFPAINGRAYIDGNNNFSFAVGLADRHIVLNECANILIQPVIAGASLQANNTFSNAVVGIYNNDSDLGIFGADFTNCTLSGIQCSRNNNYNRYLNTGAGGTDALTFTNCENGIIEVNKDFSVNNCTFFNSTIGINSALNRNKNISITGNSFTDVVKGVYSVFNINSNFDISDNVINTIGLRHADEYGIAFYDNSGSGNYLEIRNNVIECRGSSGIYVSNNNKGQILNNNIAIYPQHINPGSYRYNGISVANTINANIECNVVWATDVLGGSNRTAILHSFSPTSSTQCNGMFNTKQGIQYTGVCSDSKLIGNQFHDHDYGLVLGIGMQNGNSFGGVLGPQMLNNGVNTPGNKFLGSDGAGSFLGAATLSIASQANDPFWVNSGIYTPLTNHFIGAGTAFNPNVQPLFSPYACPRECEVDIPWVDGEMLQLEEESQELSLNPNDDELYQWLLEKDLLEKIKSDSTLLTSTILNEFYNDQQNTDKEKLAATKVAVAYITDSLNGDITPEIRIQRINDAQSKLSEVNAIELYSINEKTVTATKLSLWEDNRIELTNDEYNENLAIAYTCPYIGGPSVYEARAIVLMQNVDLNFNDDSLCSNVTLRKKKTNNKINYYAPIFYPNPASTYITLLSDSDQQYELTLQSIYSSIVLQTEIVNSKPVNIENISNGIYLYTIKCNGKIIGHGKINIIH